MNGHNINNSCSQCNNGTNHMNTTNERFDKQFKEYFAYWATICQLCKHFSMSHYWNGGGNPEYSGYDQCTVDDCECIDYDQDKDFVDVITGYKPKVDEIKTFISAEKNLLLDQAIEVVEQRAEFEAANEYTQGRHQMAIEILACLKELKE